MRFGKLFRNIRVGEPIDRGLKLGIPIFLKEYSTREEKRIPQGHNVGKEPFFADADNSERSLVLDNCPDRFGTLSRDRLMRQAIESGEQEEDDVTEINYLDGIHGKTRLKPVNYAMMIKQFLKEKKLADALAVLEQTMLEQHKAKPDLYIYNLLISGCGQYGYTKKAFQLFNQMKKRGIKPRLSTYTSLFNACSQGPWAEDALEKARHLREHMIEKGVEPNNIVYNSMIKAFGRHGDLETSFLLMDEMISKNIPIDSVTFNFLLQASASDKEAGFRHALLVWRKMLDKKVLPTIYTFNLLLRCTRDCGSGDTQSTQELLTLLSPPQKELIEGSNKSDTKALEPLGSLNLLLPAPEHGSIVSVSSKLKKPWHRLMMLGNLHGLFHTMDLCKACPDIKTFSLLIEILPPSDDMEEALVEIMKKRKIQIDVDFCNILIKKRNSSSRFSSALAVLHLMKQNKLTPNIATYGVLAMGCNTLKTTKALVNDIENIGFRVNIEILTVFLTRAKIGLDIDMVLFVINKLLSQTIDPDQKFYKNLIYFKDAVNRNLELKEKHKIYNNKIDAADYKEKFTKFIFLMEDIQKKIKDPSSEHPWKQFKVKASHV